MRCPYCNGKQNIIDVVHNAKENETYRARKCAECGALIYTVEYEVIHNQKFAEEWVANHRMQKKERKK